MRSRVLAVVGSGVESLESRRMLAANPADALAFAFPLGQADVVGVATDAAGNVYVGGHFEGTVDFNPSRRKTFAMTSTANDGDPFVAKYSPNGGLFWAVHFGKANATPGRRDVFASAIAVDATGNVYLGGHYEQTVDFDPGPGVSNLTAGTNADGDGYLLGLDTGGAFRFAKGFVTPGHTGDPGDVFYGSTTQLAVDPAGHVYATTQVTVNFGTPGGGGQFVVNKLTATGRTLWSRNVGNAFTPNALLARGLAVGPAGEVYLGGSQSGGIDFDPGAATHTLANGNAYLLKFTTEGEFAWLAGLGEATPFALTSDAAGNLYAAGGYNGTTDFNPSARKTFALTSAGVQDAFVAKYSPSGGLAWARGMGGGSSDGAGGVAVTSDGRVNVTGQFGGRASFNPGVSRFRLTSATSSDSFFARFSSDSVFQDAQQVGPRVTSVVAPATGGLFATGLLLTTGDVDPSGGVLNLAPVVASQTNLFLLKLV